MRNATKTITLFNSSNDAVTGYPHYYPTIFEGVSVYSQIKTNVDKDGLSAADLVTIRIPVESAVKSYCRPVAYATAEDKTGLFTLSPSDVIVLGEADEEDPRPAELEKKYGREYAVTIIGVTDNTDKRAPHWKVLCK